MFDCITNLLKLYKLFLKLFLFEFYINIKCVAPYMVRETSKKQRSANVFTSGSLAQGTLNVNIKLVRRARELFSV